MPPVIECKNVSVRYKTGDIKSTGLKEFILRKLLGKFEVKEFYADKDITFSIEEGDMLGIVGTNGAGKSTLLKAISGILLPTKGQVKVRGKIAALLELASGFDGDTTVRENTYLRGAMLGYTRKFLDEKYKDIIEFAELEEFQDFMFKQLSSGMKSRLAFSIACMATPEILILDEVLSVGDGAFRKKSGDKMKEILQSGVTGILVSHSVDQVREMCNKILWIDHGNQIAFSDETDLYLDAYEEFLNSKQLPKDRADIERMAEKQQLRKEKERQDRVEKETKRLEKILAKGDSESAVNAALRIIIKNRPDALNKEYIDAALEQEKETGKKKKEP